MAQFIDFLAGMFGTRAIEIIAVLCGVLNVGLIIRRSMWNYPFGIVMVILYAWIFYEVRLYSDALLQIFFLVIQIVGIFTWLNARDDDGLVEPTNLPLPAAAVWAVAATVAALGLGYVMATHTDADFPYWDATTTVLSVIAQYLMARRFLQSWLVWITVDVLAIGLYWQKDLTPTAALYVIFLGMAIAGYVSWRRAMRPASPVYA